MIVFPDVIKFFLMSLKDLIRKFGIARAMNSEEFALYFILAHVIEADCLLEIVRFSNDSEGGSVGCLWLPGNRY